LSRAGECEQYNHSPDYKMGSEMDQHGSSCNISVR
jgi:hypothetical protein